MTISAFTRARAACAAFFLGPGIGYGMLTARMPALKLQTDTNEAQIGLILLCMGLAGMAALFSSAWFIARWGSDRVLRFGALLMILSLPLCGLADSPLLLALACMGFGFAIGLTDVSMNAQGMQIEKTFLRPCMSLMYAFYSIGALTGALGSSLFAALGVSVPVNFAAVMTLYGIVVSLASLHLPKDTPVQMTTAEKNSHGTPLFVILCGLFAMLSYSAGGAVAEWGSLFLFSEKHAAEHTAALTYGVYSVSMVAVRLLGDRARCMIGDRTLVLGGALTATVGMGTVLLSPWPILCLLGYMIVGAGLSPIVPILFSRAGEHPGITPGKASAVVSLFAYSGGMLFPPSLGWLAHSIGLYYALFVIPVLCGLLALSVFLLRGRECQS